VYVSVYTQLETRQSIVILAELADMVGMSTTPEVIVANHLKLPCAAVSVITDECDPDHLKPVDIAEINAIAGTSDEKLSQLFFETIHSIVYIIRHTIRDVVLRHHALESCISNHHKCYSLHFTLNFESCDFQR
jgi:hypothetical protein